MNAARLLRIASVLTLIHAALHTYGLLMKPQLGSQFAAALAMRQNSFPAFGATRTYWDFYTGLMLMVSVFLTAEGIVFWQLGSLAQQGRRGLSGVCATFASAYVIAVLISSRYFFLPPAIVEALIAICLAGAALAQRRGIELSEELPLR